MTRTPRQPGELKRTAISEREKVSFHEVGALAVLLDCRCSTCRKVVARVRRTSGGRLYTALIPLDGHVRRASVDAWKSAGPAQPRVASGGSAVDVLVDWPADPTRYRASCPEHGQLRVDRADIVGALDRRWRTIALRPLPTR